MTAALVPIGSGRTALTAAQRALFESEPDTGRVAMARILKRYGRILPPDEMLHIGTEAAANAARTHDPSRGPYRTWALFAALRAILEAWRMESRHASEVVRLQAAVLRRLAEATPGSRAPEEPLDVFAETDTVTPRKIAAFADDLVRDAMERVCATGGEDVVVARESAQRAARALRKVWEELTPVHRSILWLRFATGTEVKEIAARHGMSERSLRRRHHEAMALVRARLEGLGVTSMPPWFEGEQTEILTASDGGEDRER